MKKALALASLLVIFDFAAVGQETQRFGEGLHTTQLILSVLGRFHVSGSLEFNGRCEPSVLVPDFPAIREPQKPYAPNPADTFQSMFSVDGRMLVYQDSKDVIRVVEAGLETDILHVRIHHLSFNRISDPGHAVDIVLGAPEVQSFMRTHGIGQPLNPSSQIHVGSVPWIQSPAPPGVPNISGELNDATLADALDYILKTFPGFWVYQNCGSLDGQRIVYFGLFPVPAGIWIWENGQTLVK